MTPQLSNTTVAGVDEVMTPQSSSAQSEMGDSDTERASPSVPIGSKTEVRTLIDLPVDVLKEIVKEAGTPSFQPNVAYSQLTQL